MKTWADLVAGKRSRWMTLAVWVLLAGLLSVLLPGVRDEVNENAPNFGKDTASVQAETVLGREFPSGDGTPALIVWHRAGGLAQEDFELIRRASADIAERPVPHQQSSVPLHQLPQPALQQQLSKDGSTLV